MQAGWLDRAQTLSRGLEAGRSQGEKLAAPDGQAFREGCRLGPVACREGSGQPEPDCTTA
jgi:hypothetical protein